MIMLICDNHKVRVKNIVVEDSSLGCSLVNDGHDDLFDLGFTDEKLTKFGLKIESANLLEYLYNEDGDAL